MITIENEIENLITFLSCDAGFGVDFAGCIHIYPICESLPPCHWSVSWKEIIDNVEIDSYRDFASLKEAAIFFVEKRHYLCLGLDFERLK